MAAHESGPDAAAPYTESPFLAFTVFCVYFARRGNWCCSAACALLAALSRPTGVIFFLPMLWEYARQHDWLHGGWRNTLRSIPDLAELAMLVAAVPAGFALYAAYLGLRYHHPLIFLHAQSIFWQYQNEPLWKTIPLAVGHFIQTPPWSYRQAHELVDLAPVVIFAVLTLVMVRRAPLSFTLYSRV